ncbi:MAG: hypothetical protein HC853_04115 [Anaerolineae bacterium]|nr:hypothetical protein [Anaerolineae bacterium]
MTLVGISLPTHVHAVPFQHGEEPHDPPVQPAGVNQMRTVELSNPIGSDPLTPSEITAATNLATTSTQLRDIQTRAATIARPSQTQNLNTVQRLYVERHDEGKSAPIETRRAAVYYYDYATNQAFVQIINLKTNQVDEVNVLSNRYLPITDIETEAALQLILDHPHLGPALRNMTFQAIGLPLSAAWQIQAQAGPFFVESMQDSPMAKITAICAYHRCAQLFIPFNDRAFIDTSNLVIDLSAGQLLWMDQGLQLHINNTLVNPSHSLYLPVIYR